MYHQSGIEANPPQLFLWQLRGGAGILLPTLLSDSCQKYILYAASEAPKVYDAYTKNRQPWLHLAQTGNHRLRVAVSVWLCAHLH